MIGRPDRPREPLPTSVDDLPGLPAAYETALERELASLGLSLSVPARTAIDGHVRLLLAWTTAINLTAIRDPAEVAVRHVADSLAALRLIDPQDDAFVDIGSGGGFPGLPLAIARPDLRTTLVESIGKKARFLATATLALGLAGRVEVVPERAEAIGRRPDQRQRWPLVTARAVGDVARLAALAFPLLRPGGRLIAWKRGDVSEEVRAARSTLPGLGGGSIEVVESGVAALADHVLVVVTKRGRGRPAGRGHPAGRGLRDPGLRKRRTP